MSKSKIVTARFEGEEVESGKVSCDPNRADLGICSYHYGTKCCLAESSLSLLRPMKSL